MPLQEVIFNLNKESSYESKTLIPAVLAVVMAVACAHTPRLVIIAEAIFDSHHQEVITSFFNKKEGTASILYGNSLAVQSAREETNHHFPGKVFTLVTWYQQPNPYWYGSNINSEIKTIEEVALTRPANNNIAVRYKVIKGNRHIARLYSLKKQERINFILAQKASVFPSLTEHKL